MSVDRRGHVRRWALVDTAFCIRCRLAIAGDPEKPLCRACETAAAGDGPEGGAFCLACGEPAPITVRDPVCAACRARLYA